jgi:long-chain acyl-CoA synthetase
MNAGIRFHADGFHRPSLLTRVLNYPLYRLVDALVFRRVRSMFGSRIKFCVGGGALLDIKQQQFFKSLGIPVYQGYGLTEAAPVISSNTPQCQKMGSSGRLLPSVECRIVKSDGQRAAAGETGEIVIRGENVMKGYFKNEKATAEAIRDGWLFTGDLGTMDEDDFLVVVGREKALLIAEDGEKYSPEEIEEAIVTSSDLISQVMLHNDHCRYTTALAVLDRDAVRRLLPGLGGSVDALMEAVRESFFSFQRQEAFRNRFPRRWLPATFQILEDGFTLSNRLMNSTMKIVRYRVTETYRELLDTMYTAEGDRPDNPRNRAVLKELFFGGSA